MNKSIFWSLYLVFSLSACSGITDTRPDPIRNSERLLERGVIAYGNADYLGASNFFSRALAQFKSIDHRQGMLTSHINLAETALALQQLPAAQQHLEQAALHAQYLDDPRQQAHIQLLEARQLWLQGETMLATQILEILLPNFDPQQQTLIRPDRLQFAALALRTRIAQDGELNEFLLSLQRLRLALTNLANASPIDKARVQRFDAQLALREGDHTRALQLQDAALQAYREAALRPAIASTLEEQAQVVHAQGDLHATVKSLQAALYIRVWTLDRVNSRRLLEQLAEVYRLLGEEDMSIRSQDHADSIDMQPEEWGAFSHRARPR